MDRIEIQPVVLAESPEALAKLCGITSLDRLLRVLQRLGLRQATVLSATPDEIRAELATPSWARQDLIVNLVPREPGPLTWQSLLPAFSGTPEAKYFLLLPADLYCDARLLEALTARNNPTILIDSNGPESTAPLFDSLLQTRRGKLCGPALLNRDSLAGLPPGPALFEQLKDLVEGDKIDVIDAATENDYVASMRRNIRPVCFAAPASENRRLAEDIIFDSAQKGTLDLPAYVHAPIEKWLVSHFCRTKIRPNQITLVTTLLAVLVSLQFAFGWLVSGTLLAMIVGVLDGLDGKQARVKVETTKLGKWEHRVDALFEASWWLALAIHFRGTGQIPNALWLVGILLGAHIIDGVTRRIVERATGRSIDDISTFDRVFRLIGGRRNVYVWLFAISLLFGAPKTGFIAFCLLGPVTAIVHVIRGVWIRMQNVSVIVDSGNPPRD